MIDDKLVLVMPGRQSIKIPKYKHLHVLPLDAEYQTGEARHFRNVGCYDTRHFRFAARTRLIGRGCYVLFHWLLLCVLCVICVSFVCSFDSISLHPPFNKIRRTKRVEWQKFKIV